MPVVETFTGGTGAHTNTVGMQMVRIPAGTFTMGSPENEPGRWNDEGPQWQVTLTQGFYMSRHTVTRGQFRFVIGMWTLPSEWGEWGTVNNNLPATYISWYHAIAFANRLSMQEELSPAYEMETTTGVWSGLYPKLYTRLSSFF